MDGEEDGSIKAGQYAGAIHSSGVGNTETDGVGVFWE